LSYPWLVSISAAPSRAYCILYCVFPADIKQQSQQSHPDISRGSGPGSPQGLEGGQDMLGSMVWNGSLKQIYMATLADFTHTSGGHSPLETNSKGILPSATPGHRIALP